MFNRTDDPFLKTVILDALAEIAAVDAMAFIIKSTGSEISIVRKKAKEIMDKRGG